MARVHCAHEMDDMARRLSQPLVSGRQNLGALVQDGVGAWCFGGACGDQLRLQLGQFGLELTVDHDERTNYAAGVAVAGGDQIIDFRIELGHKKSPATLSDGFKYRLGLASILNNTGVLGPFLSVDDYRLRGSFWDCRIHRRLSAIA